MEFVDLLKTGVQPGLQDYINERIKASNLLSIIVTCIAIPFAIFTFIYFPGISWAPLLFVIFSASVIFFNAFGLYDLSRFILGAVLVTNFTIFHSYLLPDDGTNLMPLWGLQIVLWLLPLLIYDVREKTKLFGYLIYNVLISLSVNLFNPLFTAKEDISILQKGWLFHTFNIGTVTAFLACVYFIITNFLNYIEKNKVLIEEMTDKNNRMQENEEKLNQYLKEVEKAHADEQRRKWASDGLAMIAQILRSNDNIQTIYDKLISSLIKYMKMNQGGLFIKEEGYNNEVYLELKACYAFDRKKYINKKINPGEGLIGQCYLEQEYIYMTEVPHNYVIITSGLGEATPRSILIMPLKVNDRIEGVLELASFNKLDKFEIEFVEKIAESIASAVINLKMNENTKYLLEQSNLQQEQMRAQEEEMRQNLEELMATQEEMNRKEKELQSKSEMMALIIDNIPFPVFIKDENGRYTLVNKAEADIFGVSTSEIIGYDDSKFVRNKEEMEMIRRSDEKIVKENLPVHFPEQTLTLDTGEVKVFKTSKIPFVNNMTGKINILGVSVDLSDTRKLETELKKEIEALKKVAMS